MAIQQSVDGPIRELALFAGAGGGILGGKLLGWRTVCGVERNAYCAAVLAQRQNDGSLEPFPIWSDITSFDGKRWRGRVDVVSGGFPCQDISIAGTGDGLDGDRSGLWCHQSRIIGEVRPRFAYVENSPALTFRGLNRVLGDLSAMGFNTKWGVVSGADAIWSQGTPCLDQLRERIWIIGTNADYEQVQSRERHQFDVQWRRSTEAEQIGMGCGDHIENANDARVFKGRDIKWTKRKRIGPCCKQDNAGSNHDKTVRQEQREQIATGAQHPTIGRVGWWQLEPDVVRVVHGVPYRVDRLAALGNQQIPAVAALAWQILSQ